MSRFISSRTFIFFLFSGLFFFLPITMYSQNVGINIATPLSKLDVNGNLTVGATYSGTNAAPSDGALIQGNVGIGITGPNGKLHLYEATGTTVAATAATLILDHGNSGGQNSILFKSAVNAGGDYGYIKYSDDGSGNGSTTENGLLELGIKDDVPGNSYEDDIAFMPSGNMGINTRSPNSTLHVLGAYQGKTKSVSTSVTLANDDWFVLVTNNSTSTITLPTLVSGTTDGKMLYIRATGGASTSVTIAAAAGNTLTTQVSWFNPMAQKEAILLISMGTVWYVISGD
jgi:hypothetical protein